MSGDDQVGAAVADACGEEASISPRDGKSDSLCPFAIVVSAIVRVSGRSSQLSPCVVAITRRRLSFL